MYIPMTLLIIYYTKTALCGMSAAQFIQPNFKNQLKLENLHFDLYCFSRWEVDRYDITLLCKTNQWWYEIGKLKNI